MQWGRAARERHMGWKLPHGYYNKHTITQRASETYPCSQTESAEETGVLTPKRLYFLLIIVRAAGEGSQQYGLFEGVRKTLTMIFTN